MPSPPLTDVDRARRETPGIAHRLHFNNAGAALMPQPVLDESLAKFAGPLQPYPTFFVLDT